jgi:hypothetical protein
MAVTTIKGLLAVAARIGQALDAASAESGQHAAAPDPPASPAGQTAGHNGGYGR